MKRATICGAIVLVGCGVALVARAALAAADVAKPGPVAGLASLTPALSPGERENSAPVSAALAPANVRFEGATPSKETPDFRRHVVPLFGRLGCNGRACHGSFQGRGGFHLSLFGYDFAADYDALLKSPDGRVDIKKPLDSLILEKPTLAIDHEGGLRMKKDSWPYRVLKQWIEGGAKPVAADAANLERLEVTPAEIVFRKPGDQATLKAVAHWTDGTVEDVTPLCRFQSNDDSVAKIDIDGHVTCVAKGDTHVVAFYDSGIVPVPTMLAYSDVVGDKYPHVPTAGTIDELVVAKLKKLGVVPADLSDDAEFLRRASLDATGTLPSPDEVKAFLADRSPDKRQRKINELLDRPAYAAWLATRLCDLTNDNPQAVATDLDKQAAAEQWYSWMYDRVKRNVPYDQLVEQVILATSRKPGQSYADYCKEMGGYFSPDHPADYAAHPTMPYYWYRDNFRSPDEMALGFTYTFLGIQLQCCQCHKHPFDRWTKQDFDTFKGFFTRIRYGAAGDARAERDQMMKAIRDKAEADPRVAADPKTKKKQINLQQIYGELEKKGELVPFSEVYVEPSPRSGKPAGMPQGKGNGKGKGYQGPPAQTAKLLGGETLDLTRYDDPRKALMDWMREEPTKYFARSIVNRIWAGYFNVGIVTPTDELSLANPPSNAPLLDYLTQAFVEHGYDLKWLQREIMNSRTYQLSWKSNDTNRLDQRNFSHALPRRMPAEVAYDALQLATGNAKLWQDSASDPLNRAVGLGSLVNIRRKGGNVKVAGGSRYALLIFGKPPRLTPCDCERSNQASLLQTIFLENDQESLAMIDRDNGWLTEVAKDCGPAINMPLKAAKPPVDAKPQVKGKAPPPTLTPEKFDALVQDAYLRTLSRPARPAELAQIHASIADTQTAKDALRDVLWALVNTKEFIVNH